MKRSAMAIAVGAVLLAACAPKDSLDDSRQWIEYQHKEIEPNFRPPVAASQAAPQPEQPDLSALPDPFDDDARRR